MKTLIIFTTFFLASSILYAVPTPIPAPQMSYGQACELVLKADKNPQSSTWHKTFARKIIYTTLGRSEDLQEFVYDASDGKVKRKREKWEKILSEWGWLITVVQGYDLSQTNTYFVTESGEVHLLWGTE